MGRDYDPACLTHQPASSAQPSRQAVGNLLTAAGLPQDFRAYPLSGGANNRTYRVESGGTTALLKSYFRHPDDRRDRARAEFAFASFAWDCGLRTLARPLACAPEDQLGLYEFVAGRIPRAVDVSAELVRQAIAFYCELNRYKAQARSQSLPLASEPCVCIRDHLERVERRIERLALMEQHSPVDQDAARFVHDALTEAYGQVERALRAQAHQFGLSLDAALPAADWCLSPSDFGFHNAILGAEGQLRFIDFEYAGWDDPGRMVCDFFCQQQVPVPQAFIDIVVEAVGSGLVEPERYRQRVILLLPVYRLKWCCIVLNDFLPAGGARRRFASADGEPEGRKAQQLRRARHLLASVATLPVVHHTEWEPGSWGRGVSGVR